MLLKKFTAGAAIRAIVLCNILLFASTGYARVGGAGGHGGGGHSGGGFHGGGFHGGGGYHGGGGTGGSDVLLLILVIIIVVVIFFLRNNRNNGRPPVRRDDLPSSRPFPQGLDTQKITTAFMAIQDAWQKKDLSNVRKWLSDGMYQRLTTQIKMMQALGQSNTLSDIRIIGISMADTRQDANYQTAEIAVAFSMNDSFTSDKYPQFNEKYGSDSDIEYWTFIRRTDSPEEKNLYDNNNCPNCGAPFEVKMGEISRCANCNTLTNSAAYDWVLSEITQDENYTGGAGLTHDISLDNLVKADPFFACQRMEDIASNIFMQIMLVLTTKDKKRLTRFADGNVYKQLSEFIDRSEAFVFDRLYLNSVTLTRYDVTDDYLKLQFAIIATYRRVAVNGKLKMIDSDFVTQQYAMELSRSKEANINHTETVYSYECSTCGAPFTDTTHDTCSYCDAPVVDKKRNWVLTGFSMLDMVSYDQRGYDDGGGSGVGSGLAALGIAGAAIGLASAFDNDDSDYDGDSDSGGDDDPGGDF